MAMEFEQAIENVQTLFVFDRRSQRQLQELAEEAPARSRDRYLSLLSMIAFAYYNSSDSQGSEMRKLIQHAQGVLKEIKRYREDRVFMTLALRLEVDLLMHLSAMAYTDASGPDKPEHIYNEDDARALSICETLLKNFPSSFDPLPSSWYSGVIPLIPPFKEQVVAFYKDRLQENRIPPLTTILNRVRAELTYAAGMIKAKQFVSRSGAAVYASDRVNRFLIADIRSVARFVEQALPQMLTLASDIALPRSVAPSQIDTAIANVSKQIDVARNEKDIRRYTGHLLQLGILHFLRENDEEAIGALVRTLKASQRIGEEDKQARQYQHERFPDIPFMIGTSFLRAVIADRPQDDAKGRYQDNGASALMQAIALQPQYHHAYVNLAVGLRLQGHADDQDELLKLYLQTFRRDLAAINGLVFRNLAFIEHQAAGTISPEIVKWVLLAQFSTGGEPTGAQKMLQELKTLFVLNAHDFSVAYLESYRTAFRMKDEDFIRDLKNDELHSALLFYISHAFTSLSLQQGRNNGELQIHYPNLDQAIELNSEALYFNARNGSALRLVETQAQILQFALSRTSKRWESINQMMGQRFLLFEEYLRQKRSADSLKDRLANLKLDERLPALNVSPLAQTRMEEVVSPEQRVRLQQRVDAT